jgi:hypothetical protein
MAIGTFSKFYYGYEIDITNNKIDFAEGGPELTATLSVGIYNPEELALEIKTQLDAVGAKTYTVTFNRTTRKFTIAANTGTYSILISTGTHDDTAPYDLLGFTGVVDLTGSITYTSDSASGSEYRPQFWLQDYTSSDDWLVRSDASVNTSASGQVEVISFGDNVFTEFNILFVTNLPMDNTIIKNNPSGVEDCRDFLTFAIKRGVIDFMVDASDPATFEKIILESTPESSKGVGFKLEEEVGKNLPGIYRTGKLKWRIKE